MSEKWIPQFFFNRQRRQGGVSRNREAAALARTLVGVPWPCPQRRETTTKAAAVTELVPGRPWVGRKAPEVVRSAQDGGAEATWEEPCEARQTRKCQGMGVVGRRPAPGFQILVCGFSSRSQCPEWVPDLTHSTRSSLLLLKKERT